MISKELTVRAQFLNVSEFAAPGNVWSACPWECAIRAQLPLLKTWASARLILGTLALPLLGLHLASVADAGGAKLSVFATVAKHASLQVLAQPSFVLVTTADIARGYVDVPSPAELAVQSNTSSGYLLIFESQGEFLRQTLVKGLGADVQLGASGGAVTYRPSARGMSKTVHFLKFRFLLSDSAQQGLYVWPLSLSVVPL